MTLETFLQLLFFICYNHQASPPQAVKSILVCMAKRVRAKTTPAVMPTAMSTSSTW